MFVYKRNIVCVLEKLPFSIEIFSLNKNTQVKKTYEDTLRLSGTCHSVSFSVTSCLINAQSWAIYGIENLSCIIITS